MQREEGVSSSAHTSPASSSCKHGRYLGDCRSPFSVSLRLIPVLVKKYADNQEVKYPWTNQTGKNRKTQSQTRRARVAISTKSREWYWEAMRSWSPLLSSEGRAEKKQIWSLAGSSFAWETHLALHGLLPGSTSCSLRDSCLPSSGAHQIYIKKNTFSEKKLWWLRPVKWKEVSLFT